MKDQRVGIRKVGAGKRLERIRGDEKVREGENRIAGAWETLPDKF